MNRNAYMKILAVPFAALVLAGCATTASVIQGSPNFLRVGSIDSGLAGHAFYMAVGNVNIYRHRAFGGVAPTGKSAESGVALEVDKSTGRILQMVTLQTSPNQESSTSSAFNTVTTTVTNSTSYVLGSLEGGISVIDIHSYASWLDALKALRTAAKQIGRSGNFPAASGGSSSTTVIIPPFFPGMWLGPWHHH